MITDQNTVLLLLVVDGSLGNFCIVFPFAWGEERKHHNFSFECCNQQNYLVRIRRARGDFFRTKATLDSMGFSYERHLIKFLTTIAIILLPR